MDVFFCSHSHLQAPGLVQHLDRKGYVVRNITIGSPIIAHDSRRPSLLLIDIEDLRDVEAIFTWAESSPLPKLYLLPLETGELEAFVLKHGISSFVIKPSPPDVVESHMRIMFRRAYPETSSGPETKIRTLPVRSAKHAGNEIFSDTAVEIDDATKVATVEGRVVELTPKEFALLRLLASRPGRVFSNEEIIEYVWPGSPRATSLDVQQYVHHLRRKVEMNPRQPRWIKNVKGFGYKLDRRLQA